MWLPTDQFISPTIVSGGRPSECGGRPSVRVLCVAVATKLDPICKKQKNKKQKTKKQKKNKNKKTKN